MYIEIIRESGDNYIYLVIDDGQAAVIDPAAAVPALKTAERLGVDITTIMVTHHHFDHTAGIHDIKTRTGASVIGPGGSNIPGLDRTVSDGDRVMVGSCEFCVIAVPGHTSDHVVYYSEGHGILFSGDLLFVGGCGRVIEGTAQQMWNSLQKVISLPDETLIYCGHEYTLDNLEFALHIEPGNENVQRCIQDVRARIKDGKPTVPSSLHTEKQINPFLRADTESVRSAVSLSDAPAWKVFEEIRRRKNLW